MNRIKEFYNKTFKTSAIKASAVCLALAVAGVMIFSLFASVAQSNWGRTKVQNIYANIPDVGGNINMTLYLPKNASADKQVPFVCATHGLYNNKEMVDQTYVELSRRGYAVVAVDANHGNNPHGENDAWTATAAGLVPVIDYFTQLLDDGSQMFPWLDFKNIGVIGHSMGGGATTTTATTYAGRETTAFRALVTKYSAAPYSLDFGTVTATGTSINIFNRLRLLASQNPQYADEINADIDAAKAENKIRASLPMAPMSTSNASNMGLETIHGLLWGGAEDFFPIGNPAGASVVMNNINTQKMAIDPKMQNKAFTGSGYQRKYKNQTEFQMEYFSSHPNAVTWIGSIDPKYSAANMFGDTVSAAERLTYSRPTLPRDMKAFNDAGISNPLDAANSEAIKNEYKAYLSKQSYFDRIWKELRDWNAGTDKDGNPHVKVDPPTGTLAVMLPIDNGDGTYSERKFENGGIYTREGLKTEYTYKNAFPSEVDPATGLRPVFRTFYVTSQEIHPLNHFSVKSAAHVNTFFMTAFGESPVGTNYAPTNQAWLAKEVFSLFAMICLFLMLIPLCQLLAKTPFFAKGVQPVARPTARLRKWYEWLIFLIPAILTVLFSAWSVTRFTGNSGGGFATFGSIFESQYFGNQDGVRWIATWAFWNGIVALVLFALTYWCWTRWRGARITNIGVKTPPGGIVRSLIMAVAAVSCFAIMVGLVGYFLNVDFRLWTFAVKWFHSFKLGTAICYMLIFGVYYTAMSLAVNNNRWKNIPEWVSTAICVIINVAGLIAILAYTYGGQVVITGADSGTILPDNMVLIALFPVVPVLIFATVLARKLYKVTGSIWLGAFINTIIFTCMSVAGTSINATYGFFRIFGL